MKIHRLVLATALVAIPATAYALSMFPVRVTVGGMPTNYRAMVIDGTTYVALRDVATLTGRQVSYNAKSRTVNISNGGSGGGMSGGTAMPNNGGGTVGQGGTAQRAGSEGKVGQLLVSPTVAIRVDKVERKADDEDAVYLVGAIRNTSKKANYFALKDAALVDAAGNTIKYSLTSNEMNGDVYANLQPGEQIAITIRFKTRAEEYNRAVLTINDGAKDIVFRASF